MKIELNYFQNVGCSVCGKEDEGIYVVLFSEDDAIANIEITISICEGCWAKEFKKFKKNK